MDLTFLFILIFVLQFGVGFYLIWKSPFKSKDLKYCAKISGIVILCTPLVQLIGLIIHFIFGWSHPDFLIEYFPWELKAYSVIQFALPLILGALAFVLLWSSLIFVKTINIYLERSTEVYPPAWQRVVAPLILVFFASQVLTWVSDMRLISNKSLYSDIALHSSDPKQLTELYDLIYDSHDPDIQSIVSYLYNNRYLPVDIKKKMDSVHQRPKTNSKALNKFLSENVAQPNYSLKPEAVRPGAANRETVRPAPDQNTLAEQYQASLSSPIVQRLQIWSELLRYPNLSTDVLEGMTDAINEEIPQLIKSNDNQYLSRMDFLVTSIGRHNNTTPVIIQKLLNYPNCNVVRSLIAFSPNITPDLLLSVYNTNPDLFVKQAIKQKMSRQNDFVNFTRDELEQYNQLKGKIIVNSDSNSLSMLFDSLQTQNVFQNQKMLIRLLVEFANNCYITSELINKIFLLSKPIPMEYKGKLYEALGLNPNTPGDILDQMLKEADPWTMSVILKNPNISINTLTSFVNYPACEIRRQIVLNPSTPTNIIDQLRDDPDLSVKETAAQALINPNRTKINTWNHLNSPTCSEFYKNK